MKSPRMVRTIFHMPGSGPRSVAFPGSAGKLRREMRLITHTIVTGDLNELLAVIGPPGLSCKPIYGDLREICREMIAVNAAGGGK